MGKPVAPDLGGFNDFPPHWQEVTATDFWQVIQLSGWGNPEYRQMRHHLPSGRAALSIDATLFHYPDYSGVGVRVAVGNLSQYPIPTFFKFEGCQHKYKTTDSGRQHYTKRCSLCGHSFTVDSSG